MKFIKETVKFMIQKQKFADFLRAFIALKKVEQNNKKALKT
jgi:hypothetical protein